MEILGERLLHDEMTGTLTNKQTTFRPRGLNESAERSSTESPRWRTQSPSAAGSRPLRTRNCQAVWRQRSGRHGDRGGKRADPSRGHVEPVMSVTAKSIEECLSIISQLQKEVERLTAVADACRKRLEGLEVRS